MLNWEKLVHHLVLLVCVCTSLNLELLWNNHNYNAGTITLEQSQKLLWNNHNYNAGTITLEQPWLWNSHDAGTATICAGTVINQPREQSLLWNNHKILWNSHGGTAMLWNSHNLRWNNYAGTAKKNALEQSHFFSWLFQRKLWLFQRIFSIPPMGCCGYTLWVTSYMLWITCCGRHVVDIK